MFTQHTRAADTEKRQMEGQGNHSGQSHMRSRATTFQSLAVSSRTHSSGLSLEAAVASQRERRGGCLCHNSPQSQGPSPPLVGQSSPDSADHRREC